VLYNLKRGSGVLKGLENWDESKQGFPTLWTLLAEYGVVADGQEGVR